MPTLTDLHQQFAEAFPDKRIRPLAWLLSKKLLEGNICIQEAELSHPENGSPYGVVSPLASRDWGAYISDQPDAVVPFIKQADRYYIQRYFRYETIILELLGGMLRRSREKMDARKGMLEAQKELIHTLKADYDLQGLSDLERVDWQLVAAIQAQLSDFFIITGGPGTGKTTTLAKLLRVLLAITPDARIALAAPTGKASMRMAESLRNSTLQFPGLFTEEIKNRIHQLTPSTLHKLLGYRKDSIYFKHNADHPLPYDVIIVDEASMVDVPMFAKLLGAMGPESRLILLGDKDQLASVEAGSLLGDLCSTAAPLNRFTQEQGNWINGLMSGAERQIPSAFLQSSTGPLSSAIVELRLSHRFRNQSAIGKVSRAVIQSDLPSIRTLMETPLPDLVFDTDYSEELLKEFVQGYAHYIQEQDTALALKNLQELRVLTTVREGSRGLYAMNRKIEQLLQESRLIAPGSQAFYEHRPVIITRNNYELGLFNGDIGIVRKDPLNRLRVWFEAENGVLRSVLPAYLNACETVFAMTIHKSQGSEFNQVMVVLPEGTNHPLLTRELLYTGITRARKKVIISGKQDTLEHTVSSAVQRISGIDQRLSSLTF
jgi:exodeoxyribonuclease V alpha subunit